MKKLLVLLLPLGFVHAQTFVENALPRAAAIRRAPGSVGGPSAPGVSVGVQSGVLPRILSDGNWATTVVLLNTGSGSVTFQQFFFAADGKPASYTIQSAAISGSLTTSALQGVLAPGSSLSLALSDASGTVPEGWSLLTYNAGQGVVEGYAVVRRKALGGGFSFETAEPFSGMLDYSACVPFDNTQGFATQLTLLNPAGNVAAQVQLTYLNPQGQVLLIDSVTLQAAQQMTLVLPDTYPDLANKSGSVLVQANINLFSVTGLRYNDAYGVIAALPVFNKPASLPE